MDQSTNTPADKADAPAPSVKGITDAASRLSSVVINTPLSTNSNLSEKYNADISLKREDLQAVRSFKIRGAYNKICKIPNSKRHNGVVCASAGNHSQGVAFACAALQIKGVIFMPASTPAQKVKQTRSYGKGFVEVVLVGDTFDEAQAEALSYQAESQAIMIHAFDDIDVMEGQGTVALEILQASKRSIDYLFIPVGGGGLASGVATYFKSQSPHTIIVGVEPEGAASMQASFDAGKNIGLDTIDSFVDGAAVKRPGDLGYQVCRDKLDHLVAVPEGKACATLLELYNEEGIVVEPAGALSIAALDFFAEEIRDKHVVCLISGGNNDIDRTEEIKERALLYEGRKHYFVINLAQRAGALKEFVVDVLGPEDDIVFFEYSKKTNRTHGPAIVGIETPSDKNFLSLKAKIEKCGIKYEYLNNNDSLFRYIV
ncbi:MAG: threonine dehydratase [SAR86 cluster bacterium]|uniref:L-threonine dehydratase n=1 Tax=SAR86 cluster bacterium TaxID=2030880 RepID=A0A2A5ASS2_9GAMM|nr:MAG: threonine dehydratase [SAR86 cluster bacterium]